MTLQLAIAIDAVFVADRGRRSVPGVDLERRLRRQQRPGARADVNRLLQAVSGKDSGTGAHDDDAGRAGHIEGTDAKGRLGI